jgi:YegS/Rv2252/BmrU family lipid kinase
MDNRKYFLIVNLIAGRGHCRDIFPRVKAELDRRNLSYDTHFTNEPMEAVNVTQMVIEAGFTHIIAMGGDGTINEVVNGIVKSGTPYPLGVIPAGSGNDFARVTGIPTDPMEAIELLVSGKERTIDLGYIVDDRYFVNGVGIGIDAQAARDVLAMNHLRGTTAYLYAAVKEVILFKAFPVKLVGKDWTEEREFISIGIANGKYSGGGFKLAPRAKIDDGLLDIATIEDFPSRIKRLINLPRARKGTHLGLAEVQYHQDHKVTVSSPTKLVAHIDGEVYRLPKSPFEITVAAKMLRVIAAPPESGSSN